MRRFSDEDITICQLGGAPMNLTCREGFGLAITWAKWGRIGPPNDCVSYNWNSGDCWLDVTDNLPNR